MVRIYELEERIAGYPEDMQRAMFSYNTVQDTPKGSFSNLPKGNDRLYKFPDKQK